MPHLASILADSFLCSQYLLRIVECIQESTVTEIEINSVRVLLAKQNVPAIAPNEAIHSAH